MNNIKLVIFDLDGVLVDACDLHYESLNLALEQNNQPKITREDHIKNYNGLPTKTKLRMMGYDEDIIKKIEKNKQDNTLTFIEKTITFRQEKVDLLKYLKQCGIYVGCVTNSIRITTEKMLKNTGIFNLFDFIITNEDVSKPKPDPEGYLKAIEKYKNIISSVKNNVVIVEDSEKGIQSANLAGASVLIVKNPDEVNIGLFDSIIPSKIEKNNIKNMKGGWFVGCFEPTIDKNINVEVGYRNYRKNEDHDMHYHAINKEINLVTKGKVEVCGEIYEEGDIFVVYPYKVIKPIFHEDSSIVCVKIPSTINDKYVVKEY